MPQEQEEKAPEPEKAASESSSSRTVNAIQNVLIGAGIGIVVAIGVGIAFVVTATIGGMNVAGGVVSDAGTAASTSATAVGSVVVGSKEVPKRAASIADGDAGDAADESPRTKAAKKGQMARRKRGNVMVSSPRVMAGGVRRLKNRQRGSPGGDIENGTPDKGDGDGDGEGATADLRQLLLDNVPSIAAAMNSAAGAAAGAADEASSVATDGANGGLFDLRKTGTSPRAPSRHTTLLTSPHLPPPFQPRMPRRCCLKPRTSGSRRWTKTAPATVPAPR